MEGCPLHRADSWAGMLCAGGAHMRSDCGRPPSLRIKFARISFLLDSSLAMVMETGRLRLEAKMD